MVGVDEEVLVSRTVQQPAAGAHRADGVVIPRSAPRGMAQLQLIVEEVADAEQLLAIAVEQDCRMPRRMTGSVDDTDAGKDLGVIVEGRSRSPKSLIASRADARCSSAVPPAACVA